VLWCRAGSRKTSLDRVADFQGEEPSSAQWARWRFSICALTTAPAVEREAHLLTCPWFKDRRPNLEDEEACPTHVSNAYPLKAPFAEIDALLDRTGKVLAGEITLPTSRLDR
jgi:hypothetical protein